MMELFHWLDAFCNQDRIDWILDIVVKTSVIAVMAIFSCYVLRKWTATVRHVVLACSLIALLFVPLATLALPAWNIVPTGMYFVASSEERPEQTNVQNIGRASSQPVLSNHLPHVEAVSGPNFESPTESTEYFSNINSPESQSVLQPQRFPRLLILLFLVWAIGAFWFAIQTLRGMIGLFFHSKQLVPCDSSWLNSRLADHAAALGIAKPNLLLGSPDSMPIVWGLFRPILSLPVNATEWSNQKCDEVILHELAHIKRLDPLTSLLGRFARALYWFNPLIWILNRQMMIERELACDDIVVGQLRDPKHYAETLLSMTLSSSENSFKFQTSAGMAGKLKIERRIESIVSPETNRRPIGRLFVLALSLIVLIASGLFSMVSSASPPTLTVPTGSTPMANQESTTKSNSATAEQTDSLPGNQIEAAEPSHETKKAMLSRAVRHLESEQAADGSWDAGNDNRLMKNGMTALATLALVHSGEAANAEKTRRAVEKTASFAPKHTYVVALQTMALCRFNPKKYEKQIDTNIEWLCKSQNSWGRCKGGWSYVNREHDRTRPGFADGSNTRFAVWALAVAAEHGFLVPHENLQLATKYWLDNESLDGGWDYGKQSVKTTKQTATMTLSGIACLSLLKPHFKQDDPIQERIDAAIARGWQVKNLSLGISRRIGNRAYGLQIYSLAASVTDIKTKGLDRDKIPNSARIDELLQKLQKPLGGFHESSCRSAISANSLCILAIQD